jgi:hypothetical protein
METWAVRASNLRHSRRLRVTAIIVTSVFAIFTLAGFFGVPWLVGYLARGRVADSLHRRVAVGAIRFNPYTLRFSADALHVSEREGSGDFAAVGQIRFKASWSSLYRFAPIIQEVTIDAPMLNVVRNRAQVFNFADLLETTPAPSTPATGKRWRFAISNIRVNGGQIHFNDQAFNERHAIEEIQIGVPFIANLPADTGIYVQPLLRMMIDGSRFRLMGVALPFASTPESRLDFRLKALDLTHVAAYLAHTIPVKIPHGTLSSDLHVHFVQPTSGPVIKIGGTLKVNDLDMRDASNAPLVSFKITSLKLLDLEPLHQIAILGDIGIDGLSASVVRNPDGATNLSALTAPSAPAKQSASAPKQGEPFYLFVHSFNLANSELELRDKTAVTPVSLALKGLHIAFKNFASDKKAPPVPFQMHAHLGDGSLGLTGTLDLPHSRAAVQVALDKIDLPPLQAFGQQFWAGTMNSGKLSAKAQVQSDFAPGKFNIHVQPGRLSLDTVELRAPGDAQKPVQLKNLSLDLDQADLNAHQAAVKEVRLNGLTLFVRRSQAGTVSLDAFLHAPTAQQQSSAARVAAVRSPGRRTNAGGKRIEVRNQPAMITSTATAAKPAPPAAPVWRYKVASVAVENVETEIEDDSGLRPIVIKAAPLNVHLKDLSSDLSKPIDVNINAALKPYGGFKINGTVGVQPPAARLHVVTNRIDLSPADVYLGSHLNAKLTRGALSMDGNLEVARRRNNFNLRYVGNATVGNLRMIDKVTNERFLRWAALRFSRINADIGAGRPRVSVGEMALADFYARVILNSNGKLNLSDLIASPKSAPKSITRVNPESQSSTPAAKLSSTTAAAPVKPPIDADVRVGRITLQGGAMNYTDNFIKPHYTADLTDLSGRIGGFGTRSAQPAQVDLQGQVISSAPIAITGSINPLAPEASLDIKAKADGVELTGFTPYSAKYTGYPITKGTLNVDVHYVLQNDQLTASNHLFISQLTFGDRVPSPSAINLPIAMAVSLLKNPRGEIDITVPVSGSLNDPQFSIGALILQALKNLILKIVESPFLLLASVAGAAGGSNQNLQFVAFPAGLDTLTPAATSQLSTVAKAMQNRPGLKLTMSGHVDPKVDGPGLREAVVDRMVKMQKVKEIRAGGGSAEVGTVELTPDEYNRYLKVAYKAAKFDKPRNFLGLNKSLPPDEMKKLLAQNTKITEDDLKQLANARAVAVRCYLGRQVDPVRLAVIAPNVASAGANDKGQVTGVDLAID